MLGILLALTVMLYNTSTAQAASISLSPTSGNWGSSITVTGSTFGANETPITITYDGTTMVTTAASAIGTWSATITVPFLTAVTTYGTHTIGASGPVTVVPVTTSFSVPNPSVSVSRASGASGSNLGVNGSGFGSGESGISVLYDAISIPTGVIATPLGNWNVTIVTPSSPGGSHTIKAFGNTTQASSVVPVTFQITPTITSNQSRGGSGTSITMNGSGFAANEGGITVTFDGTPIMPGITATAEGTWNSTFSIPASAGGSHSIKASGSTTLSFNVSELSFVISPSMTINRGIGTPGTSVTVNGAGYNSSETGITVTFDGTPIATGISANAQGSWTATFNIPPSTFGSHAIRAYGSSTSLASVAEVGFVTQGGIVLSRSTGAPGNSVTVNGSGFNTNESGITVTYDGAPIATGISANAQGAWSTIATIPPSTSGSHIIKAYGVTTPISSVNEVSFSIQGGISLSRNSGSPGSLITVNGSGFGPGEGGVSVTYDGVQVASGISANPQGAWSTSITVPASTSGQHSVRASGSVTQASSVGESALIVIPGISLSRASAGPGSSITISGAGFGAGESGISITYDGATVASGISANPQGSWSSSLTIPASTAGSHSIKASGSTTQAATAPEVNISVSPGISLSRTSIGPGSSLTVTGSGFGPGESGITVTYDGNILASNITATSQGSWTTSFTVPQSTTGVHSIKASGSATQAASVPEMSLSVIPSISLSRTSAAPGTSITVTGAGFSPNETAITLTYDGSPVSTGLAASPQGAWTTTFTVPPSTAGSHSVKATGSVTQAASAPEVNLSINPSISLSRSSAPPGTPITVSGSGFSPNETGIAVTYDGTSVAAGISANAQGAWTTTFAVPPSVSGPHSVRASGSASQSAIAPEVSLTVGSSLSLSRTTGAPGTVLTVTGSGFGPGETGISVSYDNTQVVSSVSANIQGSWTATFTIPQSISGSHSIKASGPITQSVSGGDVQFNVVATLSLNPDSGRVASKVDITGTGFAARSPLKVSYDDIEIPRNGDTTDASGSFAKSFTVPKSKAGSHTIRVEDGLKNEAKVVFTMENTAPPVPRLVSPGNNASVSIIGNSTPTFRWADVTDPSGITYSLQINIVQDFSQPLLEKADLTTSNYTLTKEEALPRGEYYWRVQAIDGASNASNWSQPYMVKSGLMALWTLIVLIMVGMGVVGAAVYYILLRRPVKRPVPVPQPSVPVIQAYWREIESTTEEASKPRMLPWGRKALPAPSKTAKTLSPEDHARLKIIADFAQSLPLVEPGLTAEWLVELVEATTGEKPTPDVYEQLLRGQMVVPYEPLWTSHPLYTEMRSLLEGQPILDELDKYIDSVSRCASDSLSVLQDVYRDAIVTVPTDLMARGGWSFISATYTDSIGWFRGKSLREPSERDYMIKVADSPEGGSNVVWLYGGEATSFSGQLIQAVDEKEAEQLRILHLKLRRNYRSSEKVKQLVAIITQIQVQRLRLLNALNQFGQFPEGS